MYSSLEKWHIKEYILILIILILLIIISFSDNVYTKEVLPCFEFRLLRAQSLLAHYK